MFSYLLLGNSNNRTGQKSEYYAHVKKKFIWLFLLNKHEEQKLQKLEKNTKFYLIWMSE